MEKLLDKDIGVHFYEGPDDEKGYIHTIAKAGTTIPFKGEKIASFVGEGQDMVEFTLFEAIKEDPDPDEVMQDYRQAATFVFRFDKKGMKDRDTEVNFVVSIDRYGKLSLKLLWDAGQVKTLQLTEASMVDEIEELSTRAHEAFKDVRCTSCDGFTGWRMDPDMSFDGEDGNYERLHKWLAVNDEILKGLKENRDVEEGQRRRYCLPKGGAEAAEDETDAERMLKRMDGLISQGLDHVTGQRRRKLERAYAKT